MKRGTELLEVTRVQGDRPQGAAYLYAYGYADLSAVLGESAWSVAAAVVDGVFEPMSLLEVAYARRAGLPAMYEIQKADGLGWRRLAKERPEVTHDVCRAYPPPLERPYGLADLWGYTAQDVSLATELPASTIRGRLYRKQFHMSDFVSIVDFVIDEMQPRTAKLLGLT